jgi:hypothetical protein
MVSLWLAACHSLLLLGLLGAICFESASFLLVKICGSGSFGIEKFLRMGRTRKHRATIRI